MPGTKHKSPTRPLEQELHNYYAVLRERREALGRAIDELEEKTGFAEPHDKRHRDELRERQQIAAHKRDALIVLANNAGIELNPEAR
jgi:hypothetical protein